MHQGVSVRPLRATWSFLLEFRRALAFGVLATFLSGFGQTFFVSLFVPSVSAHSALSEGAFGHIYAGATLLSGLLLMRAGRLTDHFGERPVFAIACGVVIVGTILLAVSSWVPLVFIALLLLRFSGQGVLPLVASSAMARSFVRRRGMALGISSLGFPASEIVLPGLTLLLLSVLGWQAALWSFAGLLALLLLFPGSFLIRQPLRGDVPPDPGQGRPHSARIFPWWREPFFLLATISSSAALALSGTALFLYQVPLGEARGWSAGWVTTCFTACAVTRALLSVFSGPLIDRFTGTRIMPWTLFPGMLGFLVLWGSTVPWSGLIAYILIGASFGSSSAIMAAMAEQYGRDVVGQVRGSLSAFGVISTSVGAFLAGLLLQLGFSYTALTALLALVSFTAWLGCFSAILLAPSRRHPR